MSNENSLLSTRIKEIHNEIKDHISEQDFKAKIEQRVYAMNGLANPETAARMIATEYENITPMKFLSSIHSIYISEISNMVDLWTFNIEDQKTKEMIKIPVRTTQIMTYHRFAQEHLKHCCRLPPLDICNTKGWLRFLNDISPMAQESIKNKCKR